MDSWAGPLDVELNRAERGRPFADMAGCHTGMPLLRGDRFFVAKCDGRRADWK